MSKGAEQQAKAIPAAKASIAKEKLCDEEFDKLVIDTSFRVSQQAEEEAEVEAEEPQSGSNNNQEEPKVGLDNDNSSGGDPRASNVYNRLNQPKRPMNAFMVWGQAIRRNLHLRFSNVQNALLSKALGRVWRSLEPSQKEPYVRRANLIKANHKRDYPDYRYQPRRIQERRSNKSNVLIGISLKHPVNETGSFSGRGQSQLIEPYPQLGHNQQLLKAHQMNQFELHQQHHHHHHHQQQHQQQQQQHQHHHHQNHESANSAPTNLITRAGAPTYGNNPACLLAHHQHRRQQHQVDLRQHSNQLQMVKEGKPIEGVQTFEYQPYPTNPPSSSANNALDHSPSFNSEIVSQGAANRNNNSDYSITANHTGQTLTTSHNNAASSLLYNHQHHLHLQQQQQHQQEAQPVKHPYSQLAGTQANYPSYQQPVHYSSYAQEHTDINNYPQFNPQHHQQQQLAAAVTYQDNSGLKMNTAINNYYEIASMTNMTE